LDFVWLWTAGKMVVQGSGSDVYDFTSFSAVQADLLGGRGENEHYYHWIYPPILLLITAPFAILPYVAGFFAWTAATTAFYASAIYRIVRRRLGVVLALVPISVAQNFYLGHTGALTAGILGFALVLMERAPLRAGLVLGLLAYKPQFGLLFPVVLIIAGCWRVIAGAVVSVLALSAATALVVGAEAWPAFAHSLLSSNPRTLMPYPDIIATLNTVFGTLSRAGVRVDVIWATQIAVAAGAVVVVYLVWRRPAPHELKAAVLAAGTLLATPYLLWYDIISFAVPTAFIIRFGLTHGFLSGERFTLLLCFLLSLCAQPPVGPIVLVILMGLILRRAAAFPILRRDDHINTVKAA